MTKETPTKPRKRTQERTEITKAKLLEAASELFSYQGYDGVTAREIEKAADVHRGLVAYHFTDKASLWRAVADHILGEMRNQISQREDILNEVSKEEQLAVIVRFYVRFNAKHPNVSALVSQEARIDSWRIRYLIDKHIKPGCDAIEAMAGQSLGIDRDGFVHWYYIMISASSTLFYFAPECRLLFDVDSTDEKIIDKHADLLVQMLVKNPPAFTPSK